MKLPMTIPNYKSELSKLADSFDLLRSTTEQVSSAATTTATYLENKLHDTTFRFFSVIDAVNDIIMIKDYTGVWKTLNKAAQDLYSIYPADYIGKTDEDLAIIYPHHKDGFLYCKQTDDKAWANGKEYRETEKFVINNVTRYFDVLKTPLYHEDGSPKELIIIGRDITQYVESQQKNSACTTALNSASDNIVILDKHLKIMFCNNAFIKAFGYNETDELLGKHINIIQSPKTSEDFVENMWESLKQNIPWIGCMFKRHNDGSDLKCRLTIIPIMNGLPEPIHYICIITPNADCVNCEKIYISES